MKYELRSTDRQTTLHTIGRIANNNKWSKQRYRRPHRRRARIVLLYSPGGANVPFVIHNIMYGSLGQHESANGISVGSSVFFAKLIGVCGSYTSLTAKRQ